MLDEKLCEEAGAHNYHDSMVAIRQTDEALYNYTSTKIPHLQWHAMVHELRFEKRDLYDRLENVINSMTNREATVIVNGHAKPVVAEGWEIAQELARTYRCDVGFTDVPQVRTVVIKLNQPKAVTGLPLGILSTSDQVAKDFESVRKWTFGWDNRLFIMDVTPDVLRFIQEHPEVGTVEWEDEPGYRILANCIPPYNPGAENLDWGVERILTAIPWNLTKPLKGEGVKVCVTDTGIKYDHQAFWKDGVCVYKGGYNFVGGNSDPKDDHDHGTYCSGIVAEQHKGFGYKGVAPLVELYHCKVLDSKGSGSYANIAAGVDWARTNGMHIISMSLGGTAAQAVLQTACDNAWYAGLLVVTAAGNSGPGDNTVNYPAKYQSCLAVAATDFNDNVADFSSRGPEVEVAAPGRYITGPFAGNTYTQYATDDKLYMCASGTSAACPHVAAAAAIIKNWYPFISNSELRMWLRDHARDL